MPKEKGVRFIIAPIGPPGSDDRDRSDKVLKYIVTPAAGACGYKTIRADQISSPGIITLQIIQHLRDDPLVIADLTGRNPNVFYELAIRHILGKPILQIIQVGETIPFDISQIRTIEFDHHDLESAERCREELIRQIRSIQNDPTNFGIVFDYKERILGRGERVVSQRPTERRELNKSELEPYMMHSQNQMLK